MSEALYLMKITTKSKETLGTYYISSHPLLDSLTNTIALAPFSFNLASQILQKYNKPPNFAIS